VTERIFALPSWLEAEMGVAHPYWAATSPAEGETRRVVGDGVTVVHDPK
jgi:hypothetical protein